MTVDAVWVLTILAGAGAVIATLFKLLIASKDRESALVIAEKDRALAEKDSIKKSYQEIAAEALKSAMETANYYRAREGKAPIIPLPPVVSESHSPSTAAQRETALIQTMRATMAQVKVVTGQPARPEPERSAEEAAQPSPPPAPAVHDEATVVGALLLAKAVKADIAAIPERTAAKVVEKIHEERQL